MDLLFRSSFNNCSTFINSSPILQLINRIEMSRINKMYIVFISIRHNVAPPTESISHLIKKLNQIDLDAFAYMSFMVCLSGCHKYTYNNKRKYFHFWVRFSNVQIRNAQFSFHFNSLIHQKYISTVLWAKHN